LGKADIQARPGCQGTDRLRFQRLPWQIGQPIRKLKQLSLRCIQTEQADQLFSAGNCLVPCCGQTRGCISVKNLLTGTAEAAEVAYGLHPTGQFGTGFSTLKHLLGILVHLLGGDARTHACRTRVMWSTTSLAKRNRACSSRVDAIC